MTSKAPDGARIIKRYANRKLYDTGSGALTSLSRLEELVRSGAEIRVIDHDTGADMTGEVLAGFLGNSFGDQPSHSDIAMLTLLVRTPGELLQALLRDEERTEELRAMGDRVRLLSATIDALLAGMEPEGEKPAERAVPPASVAQKKISATRAGTAGPSRARTPRPKGA